MCIIRQLHLFMQMGCWLGLSKNSRSSSCIQHIGDWAKRHWWLAAADAAARPPPAIPAGARKSTFILTPQRGGGVKVLLRYFLTEKVTKRLH